MARMARAAVFEGVNKPFVMREYPVRPPEAGEVLVKVSMSTICRSDIHTWEGKRRNPCPSILGHEIIGVIDAIGSGIDRDLRGEKLREGDRITWTEFFSCGECYYCRILDLPQKCTGLRKYGHDPADRPPHLTGGFAEYCYVLPGTGLVLLPEGLSDDEATPINCGGASMVAMTEAGGIGVGDTVVIQGLGMLGLTGVALARARGAVRVIGLDAVEARLRMAERLGADLTFDVSAMEPEVLVNCVRDACPPDGADVVIEVCGLPAVISQGLDMLRKGGRYVIGGLAYPSDQVAIDWHKFFYRNISIIGSANYHPKHLVQAVDFFASNRNVLPLKDLVDGHFPLENLTAAFEKAASHQVLRAGIVP